MFLLHKFNLIGCKSAYFSPVNQPGLGFGFWTCSKSLLHVQNLGNLYGLKTGWDLWNILM